MSIVPDTKDWTWVLDRPCPECGFDASSFAPENVGASLRDNVSRWPALLAHPRVGQRPDPATWSGLEYGCHVRDVFTLFRQRLELMLTQDQPRFPNWDQDDTAVEQAYAEQDVAEVLPALLAAGERLAESYDQVSGAQWQRSGLRGDGTLFTISSFARYLIHDPVHHVHDVEAGYARIG